MRLRAVGAHFDRRRTPSQHLIGVSSFPRRFPGIEFARFRRSRTGTTRRRSKTRERLGWRRARRRPHDRRLSAVSRPASCSTRPSGCCSSRGMTRCCRAALSHGVAVLAGQRTCAKQPGHDVRAARRPDRGSRRLRAGAPRQAQGSGHVSERLSIGDKFRRRAYGVEQLPESLLGRSRRQPPVHVPSWIALSW
jgi:hypothetical protein